jgi:hypothetical protein
VCAPGQGLQVAITAFSGSPSLILLPLVVVLTGALAVGGCAVTAPSGGRASSMYLGHGLALASPSSQFKPPSAPWSMDPGEPSSDPPHWWLSSPSDGSCGRRDAEVLHRTTSWCAVISDRPLSTGGALRVRNRRSWVDLTPLGPVAARLPCSPAAPPHSEPSAENRLLALEIWLHITINVVSCLNVARGF